MNGEFGLHLEAPGNCWKSLHEASGQDLVARKHVDEVPTEYPLHRQAKHGVAKTVTWTEGLRRHRHPRIVDEIEPVAQQHVDHAGRGLWIIGVIAVDQDIHIRLYIREHATHHVTLALARFTTNFCAGRQCQIDGTVGRIVVEDIDGGVGQALGECANHLGDRRFLVLTGNENRDAQQRTLQTWAGDAGSQPRAEPDRSILKFIRPTSNVKHKSCTLVPF